MMTMTARQQIDEERRSVFIKSGNQRAAVIVTKFTKARGQNVALSQHGNGRKGN